MKTLAIGIVALSAGLLVTYGVQVTNKTAPTASQERERGKSVTSMILTKQDRVAIAEIDRRFALAHAHEKNARKLLAQGSLEAAEGEVLEAIKLAPRFNSVVNAGYRHLLAQVRMAHGRDKEARTMLEELGSDYETVRLDLALVNLNLGDQKAARKYLVEKDAMSFIGRDISSELPPLTNTNGIRSRIHFAYGMYHCGQSNEALGTPHLQSAVKAAPENRVIAYWTAKMLMNVPRKVDALALYNVAAKGGSFAKDAKLQIHMLEQMRKRWPVEFAKDGALPTRD